MVREIHDGNITSLFLFIMICHFVHFFLGIIVFSSCNYAKFSSLVIFTSVYILQKVVVCWVPNEWQLTINEMLDKVLKLENEHQAPCELYMFKSDFPLVHYIRNAPGRIAVSRYISLGRLHSYTVTI